jgi:hypothetical protein
MEDRLDLEAAYELDESPLSWTAWLAKRDRRKRLASLGYTSPEIPEKYADALRPERLDDLHRRIEDRFMDLVSSQPSHDELSEAAKQYGPTARALGGGPEAGPVDPDAWVQEHGDRFADALAAQQMFRRDREPEPYRTEVERDAQMRDIQERLDAGLDPF